jgi:A/G-specific adenine glycosylase
MHLPAVHDKLFTWWKKSGRVLPWREKLVRPVSSRHRAVQIQDLASVRESTFATYFASSLQRDPYRVIVAEMMLQQTQVDRVLPKYEAWMKQWPKIENLASATLTEVLIFWQGLGYNRRARFLWLLAREISENRKGVWPTTEKELRELPGIGQYTARAVMSFGFGIQVGVVDTNVKRILDRVIMGFDQERKPKNEKEYFILADQFLPPDKADPWNQLLMDFGSLICTAKRPKCETCPIAQLCTINLEAQQQGFSTFGAFLDQQPKQKREAKKTIRFEDTNRYFRGRIIDELRQHAHLQLVHLKQTMEERYGLVDEERFQKLINSLEKEGLIKQSNQNISLA